jgi:hypothetical protein
MRGSGQPGEHALRAVANGLVSVPGKFFVTRRQRRLPPRREEGPKPRVAPRPVGRPSRPRRSRLPALPPPVSTVACRPLFGRFPHSAALATSPFLR